MAAHFDRDDRRVIAGDVVATVGFGIPWLALVEALIARRFQALNKAGGGMERGRGGLEEIDQALVQLFAHKVAPDSSGASLTYWLGKWRRTEWRGWPRKSN